VKRGELSGISPQLEAVIDPKNIERDKDSEKQPGAPLSREITRAGHRPALVIIILMQRLLV